MTFREIEYGSPEFKNECALRQQVLREPLGLSLFDEDLNSESTQIHFGLFSPAGMLLACAIADPRSETHAKIRQVAVSPEHQRRGLGAFLMKSLEHELANRGYRHLTLHVRITARDFYGLLGYEPVGSEFEEVGLPHLKMSKKITVLLFGSDSGPTDGGVTKKWPRLRRPL